MIVLKILAAVLGLLVVAGLCMGTGVLLGGLASHYPEASHLDGGPTPRSADRPATDLELAAWARGFDVSDMSDTDLPLLEDKEHP